jgi:hypothetical protein
MAIRLNGQHIEDARRAEVKAPMLARDAIDQRAMVQGHQLLCVQGFHSVCVPFRIAEFYFKSFWCVFFDNGANLPSIESKFWYIFKECDNIK